MLLLLLFSVGCVWFGISLYSILSRGGPMLLVMQVCAHVLLHVLFFLYFHSKSFSLLNFYVSVSLGNYISSPVCSLHCNVLLGPLSTKYSKIDNFKSWMLIRFLDMCTDYLRHSSYSTVVPGMFSPARTHSADPRTTLGIV